MTDSDIRTDRVIFTVGHSNTSLETFLDLLAADRIDVLADVRSQPYSKYTTHFNADNLKAAVAARGIKYVFLGKELGGRPREAEFYDADGHVLYARVAESPAFLQGIARLEKGIQTHRVALLCSEENPAGCHRRLLVGRVLTARGVAVRHIRGDGRVQTEEDVRAEAAAPRHANGQLSLFDDEEVTEWKSTQSVLRKGQPPSSLEH